jgi:hypothetical protein
MCSSRRWQLPAQIVGLARLGLPQRRAAARGVKQSRLQAAERILPRLLRPRINQGARLGASLRRAVANPAKNAAARGCARRGRVAAPRATPHTRNAPAPRSESRPSSHNQQPSCPAAHTAEHLALKSAMFTSSSWLRPSNVAQCVSSHMPAAAAVTLGEPRTSRSIFANAPTFAQPRPSGSCQCSPSSMCKSCARRCFTLRVCVPSPCGIWPLLHSQATLPNASFIVVLCPHAKHL